LGLFVETIGEVGDLLVKTVRSTYLSNYFCNQNKIVVAFFAPNKLEKIVRKFKNKKYVNLKNHEN
jgi:hypothetical protein